MLKVSPDLPQKIHEAAALANNFLYNVKHDDIKNLEPFTYANGVDAYGVMVKIKLNREIGYSWEVVPWYPKWRWTKAIATTFGDGKIHINVRKINLFALQNYVNTCVHESMHNLGFGHGSNYYSPDKDRSIPYAMGAIAEKWPL